jgi:membrane protein DedA with SNARE-associated domain
MHVPFFKFFLYSTASLLVWNAFWGFLVYRLGEPALQLVMGFKTLLIIVGVWIAVQAILYMREKRSTPVLPL